MSPAEKIFNAVANVESFSGAVDVYLDLPLLVQIFLGGAGIGMCYIVALIFKNVILHE